MNVVVLGTGAVGGYYGGQLARAGHEVTCFARGESLAAIRQHGLEIRTPETFARKVPSGVRRSRPCCHVLRARREAGRDPAAWPGDAHPRGPVPCTRFVTGPA